ncbi:MAG: chromate transporter [Corallococcus sp.]|nr:chromate transporter [Bacillota bacterium]MCM1533880.1 chromate transporter [Corallococcus sp.]
MIYLTLFWEYFKIGLLTIGGGYAMLPLVTQTVSKYGWLTNAELIDFIGIAESTPGPFAINLATFVGVTAGGSTSLGVFGSILGAFTATFAVVLPSLVIIIIVTKLFDRFRSSKSFQWILYGVKPVVVGLILSAVISVGCQVVLPNLKLTDISGEGFNQFNWISLIIACAFFPLSKIKIKGKRIHPVFLIISAAAVGIVLFGALKIQQ